MATKFKAITLSPLKSLSLFLSLTLGALLFSSPLYADLDIQQWQTKQGLRVYFVAAPALPMVDLQLSFDAGSARDGKIPGLAEVTNTLLGDATKNLNADQIAQGLEQVGARFSHQAHRDVSIIKLRSLTDPALFQPALTLFTEIVGKPKFHNDSLQRIRKQQLISLKGQQQSPKALAKKAFFKTLYGNHPYAIQTLGTEQGIKAITTSSLSRFHKKYYNANNGILAIVGDLDLTQAKTIANDIASNLPQGNAASPLPAVQYPQQAQRVHINYPSKQTHILVGYPGMKRGDQDYFPLYLGNHVLGGGGLVSKISEEVREKRGLAYSAYSYFYPMRELGPFMSGLQTQNDQADEALSVLLSTISEYIKTGPTKAELKASKQNITGGFPLRLSSNSKILSNIANIGFYNLPMDYLQSFNNNIDSVTREQVKTSFGQRVDPEKLIIISVGPNEISSSEIDSGDIGSTH